MIPLIETTGLHCGYNRVPVVHGIDLRVEPGEVVALIGPNGAGKTTTMLTLAGHLKPLSGTVQANGQVIRTPVHRRVQSGMAIVPEERSVIRSLTVAQNLALGRGESALALELFPELRPHLHRRGGVLSGGQQQILIMGRALAMKPQLLLADELSLGLAPVIVKRLLSAVRDAADHGVGVLLIDQHARNVLQFADRAYVMSRGKIVREGNAAALYDDLDQLEADYLGGVTA